MKSTLLSAALALSAMTSTLATSAHAQPAPRYVAELSRSIHDSLPALRACYASSHADGRAAWRRLDRVRASVRPDGSLTGVTAVPASINAEVPACVHAVIDQWRVTPPAGGAPVEVSLTRAQIHAAARRGAR